MGEIYNLTKKEAALFFGYGRPRSSSLQPFREKVGDRR